MTITVCDKRTEATQTYTFDSMTIRTMSEHTGARLDALIPAPIFEALYKRGFKTDFLFEVYPSRKEAEDNRGILVATPPVIFETAGRDIMSDDYIASNAYQAFYGYKKRTMYFDIMEGKIYIY